MLNIKYCNVLGSSVVSQCKIQQKQRIYCSDSVFEHVLSYLHVYVRYDDHAKLTFADIFLAAADE